MVYVDISNAAVAVPTGSAVEVTLTDRAVMVADKAPSGLASIAASAVLAGGPAGDSARPA